MNTKNKIKKTLKIFGIIFISIILVILIVPSCGMIYTNYKPQMKGVFYDVKHPDYFPTKAWETSTPEEQGIDSGKLIEMIEYYKKKSQGNNNIMMDSITIIRNGYIVSDIYFNPFYPEDTPHIIHSCTKSIMSALIGIAIDKGYIKSVDVPVINILDDKKINNLDERLQKLTLKDLLTMQTGLRSRDSYLYGYEGLFEVQNTNDWTEYILQLPFDKEPGKRFDYSNMASFLLSSIITKSTGMDTLSFARKHLFAPLGIKDIKWEKSPQGIYIGWARMWLKPHDMAKIGLLYLQKGKWEDTQITSTGWVEESLTAHSFRKKYRYVFDKEGRVDRMLSGGEWLANNLIKPFTDGYGYQWWLDKSGIYSAVGTGGQFVIVAPQKNLIVVFTSKLMGLDAFFPVKLLDKFILPAIVSDQVIPANPSAQKELDSLSRVPPLLAKPKAVPELPSMAKEISGKIYTLESNPWNYDNLRLDFTSSKNYAQISYNDKQKYFIKFNIGLDNVHRFSDTNNNTYAAVGYWSMPDTFIIEFEMIGYSTKDKWVLSFKDDVINVEEIGVAGTFTYGGKMR